MTTLLKEKIGPYDLLDTLGRGGMGVVYLAQHSKSNQMVALKVLDQIDPTTLEAIRREVRALREISHAGVVQFVDDNVDGRSPW